MVMLYNVQPLKFIEDIIISIKTESVVQSNNL